jgi:tRNA-(ms[2]io[6]A)-hydroxylase
VNTPSPSSAAADHFPWSHPGEGLPLQYATPREWVAIACGDLDALLIDHAHCEQKAASAAMALIGRFPDHPGLARAMIALAHEEMKHFRQVLDRIEARGRTLTRPGPDRYVQALREWAFRHRGGLGPLGDLLLVCAFVEARSCERFRLLAEGLSDERDLAAFYRTLAEAEGRHWVLFRDLALTAAPGEAVAQRLEEMGEAEAAIVSGMPLTPQMH